MTSSAYGVTSASTGRKANGVNNPIRSQSSAVVRYSSLCCLCRTHSVRHLWPRVLRPAPTETRIPKRSRRTYHPGFWESPALPVRRGDSRT